VAREVLAVDLFAFGSRQGGPRFKLLAKGTISPQTPPLPDGGSTFADPRQSGLTGHYFILPQGTELPEELGVAADGIDVNPDGPHPPTHHTIFPKVAMGVDEFLALLRSLLWQYRGKLP
jgi:hypothetical protein